MTLNFALIGGKLGHSLSPQIHQEIFRLLDIAGSYRLEEMTSEQVGARVAQLRQELDGMNVTIPHKVQVMDYLDEIAPEARAIGAVNTVHFTKGRALGYNTDYFGFGRMLEYYKLNPAGKIAVVLGTGGAARAVLQYLEDKKARHLILVSRNPATVPEDLRQKFGGDLNAKVERYLQQKRSQSQPVQAIVPGGPALVLKSLCTYNDLIHLRGDIIINCTPVGMFPKVGVSPVTSEQMTNFDAAVDIVYNPAETEFLKLARAQGKPGVNGLFMLVAQAVAAEEIWLGQKLEDDLIVKVMKRVEKLL
jgi:shikimate dehydrogenase